MGRKEILESAMQTVCKDRQDKYGNCKDNFGIIAEFWTEYLNAEVTAEDVAVMMILLKIARIRTGIYDPDNYIDIAGYAACGSEIASKKQIRQIEPLVIKTDNEAAASAAAPATPDPKEEVKATRNVKAKKDLDTVANRLSKYTIAPAT